jgi:hypothetical protein
MAKPSNKSLSDYEVGYGRPPKHSQFKSGQTGNKNGRPKGQPSASEIFMREAARVVRMQVGDKIETISKLEAVTRKLFHMAMAGDPRAMAMVFAANARLGVGLSESSQEDGGDTLGPVVPDDNALRRMVSRFDHLRSN